MDITLLVLKIFGVYLVVAGLFLLFRGRTIPHLMKDFFDHPAVSYLTGIILVFLSSMYLIQYNIWEASWRTVVTVFVWLVMLKGLVYIFFPSFINENVVKRLRGIFGVYGIIAIVVGVYFFFLG